MRKIKYMFVGSLSTNFFLLIIVFFYIQEKKLRKNNEENVIKEKLIELYDLDTCEATIYASIIYFASKRFLVEWEKVASKIKVESNFNNYSKSKSTKILKGETKQSAYGLMQLKPNTAKECAKEINMRWNGLYTLYNPIANVFLGTYYFAKMETIFKKDFEKSEKAYNVGLTGYYKGFESKRHWDKISLEYQKLMQN